MEHLRVALLRRMKMHDRKMMGLLQKALKGTASSF